MILRPKGKPFRMTLGDRGEIVAWDFLLNQGFRILEKNYRCRLGEIDVIAEKSSRLVFVEVKTRSSLRFGSPQESVHAVKQHKLIQLAQFYLKEKKKSEAAISFAVISVLWKGKENPEIRFFENAFGESETI